MEEKTMSYLVLYSLSMLLATSKCDESEYFYDPLNEENMVNNCCTGTNYTETYCNKIGVCELGTHIMCRYCRSDKKSGPTCKNGRMIKLDNVTKNIIMEKINTVRTGMSNATIHGKNDELLPKAKNGLAELEWDSELALFAQLWANQCDMRPVDTYCRATRNFSNPGQVAAAMPYVMPTGDPSDTMCIKRSSLNEAIAKFFEAWQQEIKHVTSEDIQKYKISSRNDFLTLVNGKTTHFGCGLSAYEGGTVTEKGYENAYYIELVCNLSSQPIEDEPVYDYELVTDTESNTESNTESKTESNTESITEVTTNNTNEERTEQTTSPLTTSLTDPPGHTISSTSHAPKNGDNSSLSEEAYQEGCGNRTGRKPTVLILPIITVEDAPGDKYLQKLSLINDNLREYSKKALSSKNVLHNMNKLAIQKPLTSKKGSIFTRVPTFHLPSQNNDSRRKDNLQENVLLRNTLKALLEKVPKKDLLHLKEALKLLKRKQDRIINQLSTISPLLNLNVYNEVNLTHTEVPKILKRLKDNAPLRRMDKTDDDLLSEGVLKITDYGKETHLIYGDKTKYPENKYWSRQTKVSDNSIRNAEKNYKRPVHTVFGKIKDRDRAIEIQSQLNSIPATRRQIPILHAKENYVVDEKYSKFHNPGYFNLHRNDKSIINYIKDTNDVQKPKVKVEGSRITLDDSKSKRRMYLENEIYELKRKLQHLRQYIRRNDISEKDRFRPVVEPDNRRQNIKLKDVENFYMPDRAHSLHEF